VATGSNRFSYQSFLNAYIATMIKTLTFRHKRRDEFASILEQDIYLIVEKTTAFKKKAGNHHSNANVKIS